MGIIVPFGLGAAIAPYLYAECGMAQEEYQVSLTTFILFVGASMAFTAFPVLARILTANEAMTAQIGLVSMGVASVDDVLAWTVLAIATSYNGGGNPQDGAWGILISIAWVVVLMVVVRPLLFKIKSLVLVNSFIVLLFLGMCVSAWFTQVLGLHAFFGAFCFGISVPKEDQGFIVSFIEQLEVLVINFFVPLFFANTGLRTDLTQLSSGVGPILLVWVLASVGKMAPAFFLGRCRGYSWRFSFQLASLMNARGLIALVALELAQESHAFNVQVYSVFVVMALATTFMAGPMFYFSYRKSTDPPLPMEVQALPMSPKKEPSAEPKTEEAMLRCSEIPLEEQMDLTAGSYGYLFQRSLYRQQSAENGRTSVMDVFGLHPRAEAVVLNARTIHEHDLRARKKGKDTAQPMQSSTMTYPTPKQLPLCPLSPGGSAPPYVTEHSTTKSNNSAVANNNNNNNAPLGAVAIAISATSPVNSIASHSDRETSVSATTATTATTTAATVATAASAATSPTLQPTEAPISPQSPPELADPSSRSETTPLMGGS